ncbi:MAG: ATP phosphoribosyltransferase regulatory subunit [Lachnospiraceae bacterium]|nr:ATP phosphoribosyltransferase regulatory subunit [Lachnospiraceae bacterium]
MERLLIHTPEGVKDIYGAELNNKKALSSDIYKVLGSFGYREIRTPSFEFFDVFSREVGTTPSKDLFKFFDKEGNTLALRPDFTPSIARCAAKYFLEDNMPVRLCYEGNAFVNASDLQGKLKENTQMGAELLGDASADADAEMLCLVIEALKSAGFERFAVSVGQIDFFKGICEEAALDDEVIEALREEISVKNYFGAEEILRNAGVAENYLTLLQHAGDICTIEELKKTRKMISNVRSMKAVDRLIRIDELVSAYGLGDYLSYDLGMVSKFHYYTGMIFKVFTYGVGDAIVKGGRYDGLLERFGKRAAAVGCAFLLDDMQAALSAQGVLKDEEEALSWIIYDENGRAEAIEEIKKLRAKGLKVSGIFYDGTRTKDDYIEYANNHQVNYVRFYGSME